MSLDKGTSEAVPFVRIKINTLELRPNVKILVNKARAIILRVCPKLRRLRGDLCPTITHTS